MRHLILILTALASPAAAATPDRATLDRIDRLFADWARDAHAPGLAYGVVADGKLVHVKGVGVQDTDTKRAVTPDSLFRIASMSKAFTALAILKLRDDGRLQLDAPAETYVPELRGWRYLTTDSARITVRDLLHHNAGFVEDNPWGDRQQILTEPQFTAMLRAGVPFANAPGLAMEYSNFGYATLGRIVANVSGARYQDYIGRTILRPLGMAATGYDVFRSPAGRRALGYRWQDDAWVREPDMADGAFGAMGGVETSANDYAKWVGFLLSAWPARDGADRGPLKRATVREIVQGHNFAAGTMRNPAIGGAPCRQAGAYAMGWRVIDDCDVGRVVTHTGGYPGYGSVVMLLPDAGIGLYAFSSRTYGAPSLPAWRALLALNEAGAIEQRATPVTPGLATAYTAARAVWRSGSVDGAPLAMNFLMDKDAIRWRADLARLKSAVGPCDADAPIIPISAMEGRFRWTCRTGAITGRVQRAPTPAVEIQALDFAVAQP